ncbi:MAG TPA: 30S ribosomal protein S6 [Elusimicrobia bacterium]|nr:MAG: 30S ribosomal protein S6 [Elusimicrobia bacterium RIFOXYB2_FULL_62_6]HAH06245.1 30S ribosomal protein S6 [Elusimicrobiota bacterium]
MQIYETVVVIQPKLSDPEVAEFIDKTKKNVAKGGGEILSEDRWGRRKLAYPIKHVREGYYYYMKFQAPGPLVQKMSAQFRITDDVLRSMTVLAPEHKAPPVRTGPKAPKAPSAGPK